MQEPLPRLTKGRHKAGGHEACVMELVSFLNEEEWSDHPRCVQPVLAAAARAVNDRVGDEGRQRLVDLAPRLAGTAKADWLAGARLVVLCAEAALSSASVPAGRPPATAGPAAGPKAAGPKAADPATATPEAMVPAPEPAEPPVAASSAPRQPQPHRMPHEVWQELTSARRTAQYLLARQSAAERARCSWRVRATIWLLDRAGLLKRVYPFDAALQVAFAIAQIGSGPDAEPALLALLESCLDACVAPYPTRRA